MRLNSKPTTFEPTIIVSLLLCISLLATGCSANWISVALEDLPVLTQMALNIGSLATTLQSGQQLTPAETAAIQSISAQASKDLNLVQALYTEYKQSPDPATIQKIQAAITDINQNLPALLQAAHIGNAALSAKISAAINLILTTVDSFALLIPASVSQATAVQASVQKSALPHASDLKKQWNQQVCGPNPSVPNGSVVAACAVKE
jgi:hypothetical protein